MTAAHTLRRVYMEAHGAPNVEDGSLNYQGPILFYTILYYTMLCYTMLYYTILYYTILYYTILYYTIPLSNSMPSSSPAILAVRAIQLGPGPPKTELWTHLVERDPRELRSTLLVGQKDRDPM